MAIIDTPGREATLTTPRKAMASLFFFSKILSSAASYSIPRLPPSTPSHTFSESMMDENINNAESMITKWDPNGSSQVKYTSLFQEKRKEAKEFIKSVKGLYQAMRFLVSEHSSSDKLVLAQNLMQTAMKRLEMEFYQILSANREHLNPESVSSRSSSLSLSCSNSSDDEDSIKLDDEVQQASESISKLERLSVIAISDLKLIADCMITSGYGKECVRIYKITRKSIVDEGLYHLGIEPYSSSRINRMNAEDSENHIKNWLKAVKIAVKTLFNGERFLCDHVFSTSETIRDSCFSDITTEGAINLLKFPELIAKSKRSPEKIFLLMDLYKSISGLLPEIESIFACESVSTITFQAFSSLHKLGDSVQMILTDFESSIQKNSSKKPIHGGGIHPLTNSVMNFVSLLANYSGVLSEILDDSSSVGKSPFPEAYFESASDKQSPTSAVSARLAWIILVLLCKLDRKAELYNVIALSYLFLANNLQYVVEKVRSTSLKHLLRIQLQQCHQRW